MKMLRAFFYTRVRTVLGQFRSIRSGVEGKGQIRSIRSGVEGGVRFGVSDPGSRVGSDSEYQIRG